MVAAVAALAPLPASAAAPGCRVDQVPRYQFGFAVLQEQLQDVMGQPLECEHSTSASGDTRQKTSTGLAFYTRATNTVAFTDGYRRWLLTPEGLLYAAAPDAEARPFGAPPPGGTQPNAEAPPEALSWVRSVVCPVLYAHEVRSQAAFRRLLQDLLSAGFQPTALESVDRAMSRQADLPSGCLVLTFDDALYSQYANALPVLTELQVPGVFFVMPAFADGVHRYMGPNEIRTLYLAGHEVEAHTCNHPSLPALARRNYPAFTAELVDCKRIVEEIIGAPVPFLAYPDGTYDGTVVDGAARAGYRGAFTTRPGATLSARSPFALPRVWYDTSEAPAAVIGRIHAAGG